jgi:ABC-type multidrug transport system fused ATPase/permease subunit
METFMTLTWNTKVIYCSQDVILFGGTIKENIAYGKPDATETEIMFMAKQANALNFMKVFWKFETIVGERGVKLSEVKDNELL